MKHSQHRTQSPRMAAPAIRELHAPGDDERRIEIIQPLDLEVVIIKIMSNAKLGLPKKQKKTAAPETLAKHAEIADQMQINPEAHADVRGLLHTGVQIYLDEWYVSFARLLVDLKERGYKLVEASSLTNPRGGNRVLEFVFSRNRDEITVSDEVWHFLETTLVAKMYHWANGRPKQDEPDAWIRLDTVNGTETSQPRKQPIRYLRLVDRKENAWQFNLEE